MLACWQDVAKKVYGSNLLWLQLWANKWVVAERGGGLQEMTACIMVVQLSGLI